MLWAYCKKKKGKERAILQVFTYRRGKGLERVGKKAAVDLVCWANARKRPGGLRL